MPCHIGKKCICNFLHSATRRAGRSIPVVSLPLRLPEALFCNRNMHWLAGNARCIQSRRRLFRPAQSRCGTWQERHPPKWKAVRESGSGHNASDHVSMDRILDQHGVDPFLFYFCPILPWGSDGARSRATGALRCCGIVRDWSSPAQCAQVCPFRCATDRGIRGIIRVQRIPASFLKPQISEPGWA